MKEKIRIDYCNSEIQNKIKNMVYKGILNDVEKKLYDNKEVQELNEKIDKNNETYFNKEYVNEFQSDNGFFDDEGEYYSDWRYEETYYNNAKNFVKNYDSFMKEKEILKAKLEKGFHFNKQEKLNYVNQEIKSAKKHYDDLVKIFADEQKFIDSWYVNGKFVDKNKDYKNRINEIKQSYLNERAEKYLQENIELLNYNFESISDKNLVEAIKIAQEKVEKQISDYFSSKKDEKTEEKSDNKGPSLE